LQTAAGYLTFSILYRGKLYLLIFAVRQKSHNHKVSKPLMLTKNLEKETQDMDSNGQCRKNQH
jgi:hypothetical protein